MLTAAEKQILSDWAAQGKPEGDPADNPGLPVFPEDSQIGTPTQCSPCWSRTPMAAT